jgi:CHAT domain-containing protein/tetratricopeptide (TPR) repeat protein
VPRHPCLRDRPPEAELRSAFLALRTDAERLALIEANPDLSSWAFLQSLGAPAPRDQYLSSRLLTFALKIARERGDNIALRSVLPNLGNASSGYGNFEQAALCFEEALEFGIKIGDKDYQRRILLNLGNVYGSLNRPAKAIEVTKRSIALAEELGKPEEVLSGLINLSNHHRTLGDTFANIDVLTQARDLLDRISKTSPAVLRTSQAAAVYLNLGASYKNLGDAALAMEYYGKSLEINRELGRTGSAVYINMANAHLSQGEPGRAMELFDKAIAAEGAQGNKGTIANAYRGKALVCRSQGEYQCVFENYKKSYALVDELGRVGDADRLEIAVSQYRVGQHDEALAVAEPLATRAKRTEFETEAFYYNSMNAGILASRIHAARGNRELQRKYLDAAIKLADEVHSLYSGAPAGLAYLRPLETTAHYDLVEILLSEGNFEQALSVAEQIKARAIVDILTGGKAERLRAMTSEQRSTDEELTSRLTSLSRQISAELGKPATNDARLRDIQEQLRQLRLKRDSFQLSLYRAHPEMAIIRGNPPRFRIADVDPALISKGSAVVEFAVTDNATFVFVMTRDSSGKPAVRAARIALEQDRLAAMERGFTRKLEEGGLGFAESSRQLYDVLLKPIDAELSRKTKIVIVPDGPLWNLPFQALMDEKGRYLLENAAVSYAPSLTALKVMSQKAKQRRSPVNAQLIAFGNPIVGKSTTERVKRVFMNESMEPLPEAERLVNELGKMYGPKRSRVFTGAGAKEEVAKAESPKFRIVQFATHGVLNNASPMYSHLVFAQNENDTDEDGLLEAWEIKNMDLNADMVILTACETSRGRVSGGEGMIGMTWASFIAGAPTTVASQWKVESASTTELMLEFHRQLLAKRKVSKSEALRRAGLKVMRMPKYRHPSYWAGFVIVGDAS